MPLDSSCLGTVSVFRTDCVVCGALNMSYENFKLQPSCQDSWW